MKRIGVVLGAATFMLALASSGRAQPIMQCLDASGKLVITNRSGMAGLKCSPLYDSSGRANALMEEKKGSRGLTQGRQESAEACKARDVPGLQQAIKVLRRLESATSTSIAYREYAALVTDAKVNVDEYLRESGRCGVQKAIGDAMDYHVVASAAWNGIYVCPAGPDFGNEDFSLKERLGLLTETEKFWGDLGKKLREIECFDKPCNACRRRAADRLRSDLVTECPQYTAFLDQMEMGFAQGGLSIIWSCASSKRADAEKLLTQEGR